MQQPPPGPPPQQQDPYQQYPGQYPPGYGYPHTNVPSANSHMVAYGLIGIVIWIVGSIVLGVIGVEVLTYIGWAFLAMLIGYLAGGAALGNGLARSLSDAAIQGGKATGFALGVLGALGTLCITIAVIAIDDALDDASYGVWDIGTDNMVMIILGTAIGAAIIVLIGAAFGAVGGMFAAMQKGVR